MPTIYDNVERKLVDGLRGPMGTATATDFCVGYFNLRGWGQLADLVDGFAGTDEECCRVLVGMQRPPEEEMREAYSAIREARPLDMPAAKRLQRDASESFKRQLEFGVPTNDAEVALRRLAEHLREGKVKVRLFLPYPIHAKLYLIHRTDEVAPLVGYVGSSNLTMSGLTRSGELNVDVVEQDAANKLHDWFHLHWDHKYSLDISEELADLIETSWASEDIIRPYLVYLKMVSHLSEDARLGEREFQLPEDLRDTLLDFQTAAVSLATRHLHLRGGVLLGDVVGLGKTFMATAIARIIQDDEGGDALIICPPKLEDMWRSYAERYRLIHKIVSLGKVQDDLPELRLYKLVIIDESHNLRNRERARYRVIRDYIERNNPRCLLLTATPYNKQYIDMSNQLRLFLDGTTDLGVRPEIYFSHEDEGEFVATHQASPRSLTAFEKSEHPEDWRDLMRLYMVRRTRKFIQENYAHYDGERDRYFVLFPSGDRFYFPKRVPHNLTFTLDAATAGDQYARLYRPEIVDIINSLDLPRYGLALYLDEKKCEQATAEEDRIIEDLGRAGRRLMGFCRTNLYKRLESSGHSFILSVNRHVLRNMVTLYAIQNGLPVPIGTQDAGMLDTAISDADVETDQETLDYGEAAAAETDGPSVFGPCDGLAWFEQRAAQVYQSYSTEFRSRFRWLRPELFMPDLADALRQDAEALCGVLRDAGEWDAESDTKLGALESLVTGRHKSDRVLVFSQFADTASYLAEELNRRGVDSVAAVTADSSNPTVLSRRFSPRSNDYKPRLGEEELRVLVATDILSEGQNLQDCHVVVNYDLPWAIIRLIQRAGRVDRIGQEHDTIHVYSYLPADGVERIINLQSRLRQRLIENNEVVGSDEQFFDEEYENKLRDLYTERVGAVDDIDNDDEVDLTSQAQQVWNSASEADREAALALPAKVHATRIHEAGPKSPGGALVYLRTAEGNDALVRVDEDGEVVSQSLSGILQAAACPPETPGVEKHERHHDWVASAVRAAYTDEDLSGGRLGPPRAIRRRIYERMTVHFRINRGRLLPQNLEQAIDAIIKHKLSPRAAESIGRQLRLGAPDDLLADIVTSLYDEDRLVVIEDEATETPEPDIICSMGLKTDRGDSADAD